MSSMENMEWQIVCLSYGFALLGAYLLGSIPTSVWIGKWFYNIDVREHGSKNAGATNTIRVLGAKAGLPAFFIDVSKGYGAVSLVYIFQSFEKGSNQFFTFQIILAVAAIIGHIFPVFAGFRGGKGVATTLGIVLAMAIWPALIALGLFIAIVALTRYVSVGSIVSGVSFPLIVLFLFQYEQLSFIIFSVLLSLLLIVTHRKNIQRLVKGEENKFSFKKKNS